jgi:hypothetical protein
MWLVTDPAPSDPFPAGWRFAPVDALDQANFIERVGGLREFDTAAIRIDAMLTATDAGFQHRMGWDDPGQGQVEHAVSESLTRYGMDPEATGALVGLVLEGHGVQAVAEAAAQRGYSLDSNDFCRFVGSILGAGH